MKKVFCFGLLIAAMMMVAFPSCKKEKKVTGVTLSETSKTVLVGQEFVLTAVVAPADAVNKNVSWESDKMSVATVDDNGKVKGVALGEATITVTTKDGGKTATCKVIVSDKEEALLNGYIQYLEDALNGAYLYRVQLVYPADAFNSDGDVVKAGTVYQFTFSSNQPATPTANPAMGTYTAQAGQTPMTLMMGKDWANLEYSYAQSFNAQGYFTSEAKPIVAGGTLTLADGMIAFKVETALGKADFETDITKLKTVKKTIWALEPKTQSTQTVTFTEATLDTFRMDNSMDVFMVCNQGDNALLVDFFIPKDSTKFPLGTYNVEPVYGGQAVGTIQKSKGASQKMWQMASIFAKIQGTAIKEIYYFDSGSAVVSANKIEFNIQSHFGSTLNITYNGDLKFRKPQQQVAPMRAKSFAPLKMHKRIF